ncbi:hypothetical protein NQ317_004963 [Molorchus minor]|uniref:Uncharacterized protein n=1 Tax=Molorchus minor TaxID=1323400 RepID=A0ABQ9K3P6_9CUCU|nr:hypothetical protein NQ317_004963 [Molorchus minor]
MCEWRSTPAFIDSAFFFQEMRAKKAGDVRMNPAKYRKSSLRFFFINLLSTSSRLYGAGKSWIRAGLLNKFPQSAIKLTMKL